MRRILAITLMLAFGSPLVLPLFASPNDSQANLPACCRRNGAHHCTGMVQSGNLAGPAFKAPPCPVYPSPSTPLQLTAFTLAAVPKLSAGLPHSPFQSARLRPRTLHSSTSENPKRGPPSLLA